MRYDYAHIEDLLYSYGKWRNRDLRKGGSSGSTMHTPTTRDDTASYWQPCQQCYATGADLGAAGSGVRTRSALYELAKTHKCPSCNGRRGRREATALADPAAIPATGPGGMYVLFDEVPPEFQDLDNALNSLDEASAAKGQGPRARAVIEARYVHFPRFRATQDPNEENGQKARVAWVNDRIYPDSISGPMFGWMLTTTKRRLAEIFGLKLKQDIEAEEREMAG